jgi:hypothetical protein
MSKSCQETHAQVHARFCQSKCCKQRRKSQWIHNTDPEQIWKNLPNSALRPDPRPRSRNPNHVRTLVDESVPSSVNRTGAIEKDHNGSLTRITSAFGIISQTILSTLARSVRSHSSQYGIDHEASACQNKSSEPTIAASYAGSCRATARRDMPGCPRDVPKNLSAAEVSGLDAGRPA